MTKSNEKTSEQIFMQFKHLLDVFFRAKTKDLNKSLFLKRVYGE